MKTPNSCPDCGGKLEYLSEVHLCPGTNPQEAGIEGSCCQCGAIVYSKFKMFEIEVISFDVDGNETGKRIL